MAARTSSSFPRLSTARPSMAREYAVDTEEYAATGLDEYNGEPRPSRQRRSSFRKALSLITDNSRKSVDRSAQPPINATPQTPSLMKRKSWGHLKRTSKSAIPVPLPQSPPQYYRDEGARRTLKTSLATAQSFQDALEYGFRTHPTQVHPTHQISMSPPILPRNSSLPQQPDLNLHMLDQSGAKSFFDDSYDSSDLEDDHDEPDEPVQSRLHETPSPSIDGPQTPADSADLNFTKLSLYNRNYRPSVDEQFTALPRPSHQFGPRSRAGTWEADREVTLRMTLTRPELREPDEFIYGYSKQTMVDDDDEDDALALEALPQPLFQNDRPRTSPKQTQQTKGKVRNLFRKKKR